jgi:hypothetical protein
MVETAFAAESVDSVGPEGLEVQEAADHLDLVPVLHRLIRHSILRHKIPTGKIPFHGPAGF